jgi:hypothetical protein
MWRNLFLTLLFCFSCVSVDARQVVKPVTIIQNAQAVTEGSLSFNVTAKDLVGERPNPKGVPTPVKLGIFVTDITAIDDAKQSVTASIRITARWVDARLASKDETAVRKFPLHSVWSPVIRLANKQDVEVEFPEEVFVTAKGEVTYVQRYFGTFMTLLDLRNFPVDDHQIEFELASLYGRDELQIIIDEQLTGWSSFLSIPDWNVYDGQVSSDYLSDGEVSERSVINFKFSINRYLGFYFWRFILPLALIVVMSWGVFWVDPARAEVQVGLSATAFLTLFAFQFAISALLPRVAYLTRMDLYILCCSSLIFLGFVESIMTNILIRKELIQKANTLDFICRFVFPAAFAISCYLIFFRN